MMNLRFLKITFRTIWRNKKYSGLNFVGLSFGLFCSIIAVLYAMYLFRYDKFHQNYERLQQVSAFVTFFNGDRFPKESVSASLTEVLKDKVPEIEAFTRITQREQTFSYGDKSLTDNGIYADDNLFSSFTFPLIQAEGPDVLKEINSIVISESMAKRLFNDTHCLGKILIRKWENGQENYKISGVFRNIPYQSYLQFDFVIPFKKFLADNKWALESGATATQIWVLLRNHVDHNLINVKIRDLIKKQESTLNQELFLFPLKEKILYSYSGTERQRYWAPRMNSLFIVSSIGLVILLIACFNFINLSIAVNLRRYREAGIKKVVGSGKASIIFQLLGETWILTISSIIMAILLVKLILPGLNTMFNLHLQLILTDFKIIVVFFLITFLTGLFSGLLPALYLASSNPLNVMRENIVAGNSYKLLRQGLIVFQFTIPVVLLIFMMIIQIQSRYMKACDIGVERDKLIVLNPAKDLGKQRETFKSELLSIPGIDAVSFSNCIPTMGAGVTNEVSWEGKDASEKLHFWCVDSDFDYNKTVKIQMTRGRYFNPAFSKDSINYLINDVAANTLQIKNPIGTVLTVEGKKGTVIGVFNNFHVVDLAGPYVPTILRVNPSGWNNVLIKYSSGSYSSIKESISRIAKKYDPNGPFTLRLFNELPNYSESQIPVPSNLIGVGFIIAIVLACMGLFGLASFTAERRTKEIGIRKSNGATTFSIVCLLQRNYARLLLIAVIIALPISFQLGRIFLGRFNFHAAMPIWPYLLGPGIAITVALSTLNSLVWKVARQNPVKALRYE